MKRQQQGFTLMEVLVAVAVLAIALGTIITTLGNAASNVSYLRDKTLAHWVAMNKVAELQIMDAYPALGSQSGKDEMGGHEWLWTVKTEESAEVGNGIQKPDTRQLIVTVKKDDKSEQNLVTLRAVVAKKQ